MLSCLVRHHICEIVSCCPVWLDNIYVNYHICLSMSVCSISFLVYQPFELEGVMAVSKGAKTRSSQKTVLPVDADRTMVVLAHKLAPPHIIETLPDCTLTPLGREPATTHLTATPADSNPLIVDKAPCPPQSTPTRAVCKATAVPKARRPPQLTQTPRLKQKSNCSQVRFRSYGPYSFVVASL